MHFHLFFAQHRQFSQYMPLFGIPDLQHMMCGLEAPALLFLSKQWWQTKLRPLVGLFFISALNTLNTDLRSG